MLKDAVPLDQIRRVLVIKLRHHGDVLLSAPVFSVLKAQAPQAEIDALVYAETAEMLTGHPAINDVHLIDRKWKQLGTLGYIKAEWRLLQAIRNRKYDLIVHLTEHPRGAWLSRISGAKWSVAPRTGGSALRGKWWHDSFTHFYSQPRAGRRHTVELNLDALRRIGVSPAATARSLTLRPGAEAEARVIMMLRNRGIEAGRFIHIHPASRWYFKCWPAKNFAALVDALSEKGYRTVLTCAPGGEERALVNSILAMTAADPVDFGGCLSLKELAALTDRATLFIGVDSAPMHIAAAMGTPTVAIFGPSGEIDWGPWQVEARVVTSQVHPCRPCGQDGCGGSKVSDCLEQLSLTAVLAAVEELLEK